MGFSIKNYRNTSTKLRVLDPISLEALQDPESNTYVELTIAGMQSREFADAKLQMELKTLELLKDKDQLEPSERRKLAFEMFAVVVVGWNDAAAKFFAEELGNDGKFSNENAEKLLSNPDYFWLVQQIEKCLSDRQRFFHKQ